MRKLQRKDFFFFPALLLILLGLVLLYYQIIPDEVFNKDIVISCDFESVDDSGHLITSDKDYLIKQGAAILSSSFAHSGKSSLMINKGQQFFNLIKVGGIKGEKYVKVSLSIKKGSDAFLIAQGVSNKKLYYISNYDLGDSAGDWNEIEIEIYTEKTFDDSLHFYVFNSKFQETYIDDFKVEIKEHKTYPEYSNCEPLLIYIQESEFKKLEEKRQIAIKNGVLQTEDDSFVKALIFGGDKMMAAEIRLKGDWLDHVKGNKWSFRIKLINDSWRGMTVFSIQTPQARGFTNEWLIHKEFEREGLLTTRYDFVPVYINGQSYGIYSYEEHFQKELVEYGKRREGPIIKFSEAGFWEFMRFKIPCEIAFETAVIEPFGVKKILADTNLYSYFILAQNLLESYRDMSAPASEIFDVDKLAKFYALLESRNAYHGLAWHNIRYYYNPILSRLEPVGFDMFGGDAVYNLTNPISVMMEDFDYPKYFSSVYYLSSDTLFVKSYLKYVKVFLNEKTHFESVKQFNNQLAQKDSLLEIEFKNYFCDTNQFVVIKEKFYQYIPDFIDSLSDKKFMNRVSLLAEKPMEVDRILRTDILAAEYVNCFMQTKSEALLRLYLQDAIIIKGFGTKNEIKQNFEFKISENKTGKINDVILKTGELCEQCEYLHFSLMDKDSVFTVPIMKWPAPVNYNPRTDLESKSIDYKSYLKKGTNEIVFNGRLSFSKPICIPAGYKVIFIAGTEIDFVKKAAFISESPVYFQGTKDLPVKISSSDKSAMGFTVLQAGQRSTLNYAEFVNFNTMNYNGWQLTGAVTFYESDVDFKNCTFRNNHCEDMLNTVRSNFSLKNCTFKNTYGDSHDSDFCTGVLTDCYFIDNGNDAIDFSTSDVKIINCHINKAADKGISIGENSRAIITDVDITFVNIGIASKDFSEAIVKNSSISEANYGFVVMQKKPEFGPASIRIENTKLDKVHINYMIESKSWIILDGKYKAGNRNQLYRVFY